MLYWIYLKKCFSWIKNTTGVHANGEEIAVKLLYNNIQTPNDEQFQHEFDNLMMLNHRNIVRLVGYCYETQRQHVDFHGRIVFGETTYKALCFEYMHNGSLQRHLSDEFHGLDWKKRYNIIKGACEGLKYLHEGFRKPIYHLDLKPDNILLDENMIPKLADFGLSKLFGEEQTRVTNSPAGTIGYLPPEYLFGHIVSKKLDVFSLGVVITKIIAGPKGHTRSAEMPYQEFLDQVHQNWRTRLEATCTSSRILDAYCEQVTICTEIGVSSMEVDRYKRPSILDIIQRLDETEAMIEKAISWSANSSSSMPVKSQSENNDNQVRVEAFARNKAIQLAETCDQFPVLVRVSRRALWGRAKEMLSAGIDVVLVFNAPKQAVKEVITKFMDELGPNDRLSILFVGQNSTQQVTELTYMSAHGRDVANHEISKLVALYCGTVHEGHVLQKAAEVLRQRGVEESSNRTGCILHVWVGWTFLEMFKQEISPEFPVHTIALGDHNRRDMNLIAEKTSGTYSSIENQNTIAHVVTQWAAQWPDRITIQADEGVTISSIVSGCYGNLLSSDKRSAIVALNKICAGEQKTFVVYLTVPQGKEKLVTVGGQYQGKELVGMDVVIIRPRRKCLPDEMIIHPKVAAELLRIQLMKARLDKHRSKMEALYGETKDLDEQSNAQEDVEDMRSRYGQSEVFQQTVEQQHIQVQGFARSKAIMGSKTYTEFTVLVRVSAAPWHHAQEMPRDGVDLVAVLDVSRSMQAEMLESVKQAMMIVIDKLGPDDRLSIVLLLQTHKRRLLELTYMSDDHGHGRDAARFKISQLKASDGRCTSHIASAALQEGAQILKGRGTEEISGRLGCMIFLSDGEYPEILQMQISPEFLVHTFGLGADHNSNVMKYIADMTSGTYSFVDQDISNVKDALVLFITGLTSIAATSIMISLVANLGTSISSIESGNYNHNVKGDKNSGTININHIYAGERKEFIINLIVGAGKKRLMTIGGQYQGFHGSKKFLDETDMSVLRPWLTRSPDYMEIHPDVAAEIARIRLRNGVSDMLEKQHLTGQGLEQLWNMIKHSDEGRGAPEKTLSGLSMDIDEMKRDVSGMPYTLSWLSCHKWQRATTKGAAKNCSAFRAIAQHADEDTNLVKVETFTRSKAIPSEGPCNKFPVLVRAAVAPWSCAEEMRRLGIDIVAVLDVSGRMQGEKLDRMKQAMKVVIDKLGVDDRLSIVSFGTHENCLMNLTYMSDHDRDVARLKINELVAGGQNDMSAGLREGAQILWWRGVERSSRVGCMMLLSDGKFPEILQTELDREFPVHTLGLGSDHNPKVMKYIAEMTSGTYSSFNQGIEFRDALALFIRGLTSITARSIKITLRTNEGVTISSIESGGYTHHVKSNNQSGTIEVDNISAGEQKAFIVYLRVAEGKKDLMTIGGQYLSHNTVRHLANTGVYALRPHLECVPGDLAIHCDVAAELVRIRLEKGISAMLEQGPSGAVLQQLWDEIMDSDEARATPEEALSALSMDVTEMKRGIEHPEEYRKSGLPYTLSWLSSHNWKRATIKGTPCSSDAAIQTTGHDADETTTLSN
ncbi:hypothetical protein CFC21_074946 [Triticum aestivum]|uniref:Protein kinase domain-containing protein n=2 Tax=Triticum aestivum TaxID=4565 RepID=A0A9R1KWT6_WHEAT|nr:uncharacterized protein LOC123117723 isoform X2 [Triticum aestivum]KAF7069292.1 hypothetical protein CFC21_074946 [Triticum aestivum]